MSQRVYLNIDYEKLSREFKKRGLKISEVAEELGYSKSYFSGGTKRNSRLQMNVAKLLEKLYDIRPDEYEAKEEPATVPTAPPPSDSTL